MRLALLPVNPIVGDLAGNERLLVEAARAAAAGSRPPPELIVFPECAICGYPARDLLLHQGFQRACEQAADRVAAQLAERLPDLEATIVIGSPRVEMEPGQDEDQDADAAGRRGRNSLLVYRRGRRIAAYDKRLLPEYDVFDEARYFVPGDAPLVIEVPTADGPRRVGLAVCEDLWRGADAAAASRYEGAADPLAELVEAGAEIIVAASASPFVQGKPERHHELLRSHARRFGVPVAAVNQLGGHDDLVFEGSASVIAPTGEVLAANDDFTGDPVVCDPFTAVPVLRQEPEPERDLFCALVMGIRDYALKSGFHAACLGLSGGIDSALVAVLAACALGPGAVTGTAMPSRYSSDHSRSDAAELATNLGVRLVTMPIEDGHAAVERMTADAFGELGHARLGASLAEGRPDLADENAQSRLRGLLMMALSNRTGALLLTTGNKSEYAVGYTTLYGDQNGGYAPLIDVYKTEVYRLARWINDNHAGLAFGPSRCAFDRPPIPRGTIEKPPSAELRPNQQDSDSLPEYDTLDRVLRHLIDHRHADAVLLADGVDEHTLRRVKHLYRVSEFKRWQAAKGPKVTPVALGPGRRMPLVRG